MDAPGLSNKSSPLALLAQIGIGTSRGYTGHEHLDRTGLIHMNGRVYVILLWKRQRQMTSMFLTISNICLKAYLS